MRVSLSWLREYTPVDVPVREVARALTEAGIEVGEVSDDAAGIIVARVLRLEPVAGSAHLLLADLDVGPAPPVSLTELGIPTDPLRVVTGASNLRAGDLVPYAPPGSRPPALDEPLGVRAFRGKLRSPGMLCSAAELGMGSDASGILVLERGAPGQPLSEVADTDSVLDVEVTTNRPDCLCHLGIARELAAALREPLTEPVTAVPVERESAASADQRVRLTVSAPDGCPRFTARIIENLAVQPSPEWMQRRLRAIGVRPINNVVDVTNYVAHELGQPLHAFDFERLGAVTGDSGVAHVDVRRARDGERLLMLDGVERGLATGDMVVCAGDVPVSLGGIMGGASTAVHGGTRAVLLEGANWEPVGIRATSRRLGLRTDASALFEKGLSDTLPPLGVDRAAGLIAELGGGHVLRETIDAWPSPLPYIEPITVTATRLSRLLGMQVDASEAATALARLGFAVEQEGATLVVTPPHFRRDVRIPEDVVEEVGRSLSYELVPATLPGSREPVAELAPPPSLAEWVRDLCAGAGFDEAITFSFVGRDAAALLPGAGMEREPLPLRNPLSEEWSVLRTSQLPGLAGALATNLNRGVEAPALFEVGRVFWEGERTTAPPGATPDGGDAELPDLPLEPLVVSLMAHAGEGGAAEAAAGLRQLQGVLRRLVAEAAGLELGAEPDDLRGFRRGRSARLLLDGAAAGVLGDLDGATLEALGLHGRVLAAELRLDSLQERWLRSPRFVAPPQYPPILRDLAVTVPAEQPAGAALVAIHAAGGELLETAELYDEFRGGRLPVGRKGWTFHLRFRAADRTLTAEEAQPVLDAVIAALERSSEAEVRR